MTHGVVVLCPLSYIRKVARHAVGLIQVPEAASRQLVKERPPRAVVRSHPFKARAAGRSRPEMKEARILSEPGLCMQSWKARALGASFPRIRRTLDERKVVNLRTDDRAAARHDRGSAHERDRRPWGAV